MRRAGNIDLVPHVLSGVEVMAINFHWPPHAVSLYIAFEFLICLSNYYFTSITTT